MRAFIEMLLRDVSFVWNRFGDNHTARIKENMFPIGAQVLDEAFISALIAHAKGQGFELYSREDLEAKKQRRLYKEGYGLKFNLFMSHFILLALWFDFFYTGFLFIREVYLNAF